MSEKTHIRHTERVDVRRTRLAKKENNPSPSSEFIVELNRGWIIAYSYKEVGLSHTVNKETGFMVSS